MLCWSKYWGLYIVFSYTFVYNKNGSLITVLHESEKSTLFNQDYYEYQKIMNYLITFLLTFSFGAHLLAQKSDFPKVVNVAQHSEILEDLSANYKSSLFSASDADFIKTTKNWQQVLVGMEKYSEAIDFDLKGVKIWMKVFFAKDGNIDHITYILSEKSINIDTIELEAFLRSFMRNYKLSESHEQKFSYDARILFPLYLMR